MGAVAGFIDGFRARSGEVGFLDRLDDFRGRLIRALLALLVATGIGFWLVLEYDVLGVFIAPITPYLNGEKLKYLSPTDPFFITLKLALFLGIGLALPYLLFQVWRLIAPLLLRDERRLAGPAIVASVGLFAAGAIFCYHFVLPLMLQFTMGFQSESLEQAVVVGEYLKVVIRLLVAFGLAFELPIVIVLGTLLGIVTPAFLAEKRRHAFAILTVISAIITPPDLSSQILLMIPVWTLYEISILLSRMIVSRRAAELAAGSA